MLKMKQSLINGRYDSKRECKSLISEEIPHCCWTILFSRRYVSEREREGRRGEGIGSGRGRGGGEMVGGKKRGSLW